MNIVVLCGGYSTERDVSFKSGSLVCSALRERGHNAILVDAYFGYDGEYSDPKEIFTKAQKDLSFTIGNTDPDLEKIKAQRGYDTDSRIGKNVVEICRSADIVFMALHGGDGEDGRLQALFDVEGIKYTGSGFLGSAVAMDKSLSKILFKANGVGTPDSITLNRGQYGEIGFPCVVKPQNGGSSVGVSIVNNKTEYKAALEKSFEYEETVVVETYIKGREFTVGVLGHTAMPVIEIIPKDGFYDYKNKYQAGLTEELCPAPISGGLTKKLQNLAIMANDALRIDTYCRVDFLMDESENIYCLEANTLPGMTPTSLIPQMAAQMGMNYGELCEKIIELSLKKY